MGPHGTAAVVVTWESSSDGRTEANLQGRCQQSGPAVREIVSP